MLEIHLTVIPSNAVPMIITLLTLFYGNCPEEQFLQNVSITSPLKMLTFLKSNTTNSQNSQSFTKKSQSFLLCFLFFLQNLSALWRL